LKKIILFFASIVGPAAIITAGTMGAGSTSSLILAGAWFRYDLLWVAIAILPLFVVSVDSASRIGLLNREQGMFSLIRNHVHPAIAIIILVIHVPVHIVIGMAHMSLISSSLLGLVGFAPADPATVEVVSHTYKIAEVSISVGFSVALIWLLTSGGYERMQKFMTVCMLAMFVCFLIVAVRGFQEIQSILLGFVPAIPADLPVPGTDSERSVGLSTLAIIGSVLAPGAMLGVSYLAADNHVGEVNLQKEFKKSFINLGLIYGGYSIFVIVAGGFALYPLANNAEIDSVAEAGAILVHAFPEGISFLAPVIFSLGILVAAITTFVVIVQVVTYAILDTAKTNWHYAMDNTRYKMTLSAMVLVPAILAPFWEFPALAKNLLLMGVNTIVVPLAYFVILVLINKRSVMGDNVASLPRNILLLGGLLLSLGLSISNLPTVIEVISSTL